MVCKGEGVDSHNKDIKDFLKFFVVLLQLFFVAGGKTMAFDNKRAGLHLAWQI